MDALERLHAVHGGHAHVHEDDIPGPLLHRGHGGGAVVRLLRVPAPLGEQRPQHEAVHPLVIDYENLCPGLRAHPALLWYLFLIIESFFR